MDNIRLCKACRRFTEQKYLDADESFVCSLCGTRDPHPQNYEIMAMKKRLGR